jgi:Lipopolysaccharide kinase (Kdo/WaaP) family
VCVGSRRGIAVVKEAEQAGVAEILERGSLYEYAAATAGATRYQGRMPAFGISLPQTGTRVVVRHATHGGVFARLTGDRFIAPGRAPHELELSQALRGSGVQTPELTGYALYASGRFLCTNDVLTAEVSGARDLAAILAETPSNPRPALEATARLFAALARAGAHHADLNLKNVLIARSAGGFTASVLDVDRVTLDVDRESAMRRNLARFERSAKKWRARRSLAVSDLDLRWLADRTKELAA